MYRCEMYHAEEHLHDAERLSQGRQGMTVIFLHLQHFVHATELVEFGCKG